MKQAHRLVNIIYETIVASERRKSLKLRDLQIVPTFVPGRQKISLLMAVTVARHLLATVHSFGMVPRMSKIYKFECLPNHPHHKFGSERERVAGFG